MHENLSNENSLWKKKFKELILTLGSDIHQFIINGKPVNPPHKYPWMVGVTPVAADVVLSPRTRRMPGSTPPPADQSEFGIHKPGS